MHFFKGIYKLQPRFVQTPVLLCKMMALLIFMGAPDRWDSARFQAVLWLEVDSGKVALSRLTQHCVKTSVSHHKKHKGLHMKSNANR